MSKTYPDKLKKIESEMIAKRRESCGDIEDDQGLVGVAYSGGGIRSSILSLGITQVLARKGVLKNIDYISTNSGGGYFGSFLGRLFTRRKSDEVEKIIADSNSHEVKWLRHNGNYLAPNGSGDMMMAVSSVIRNWMSLIVVFLCWAMFYLSAVRLVSAPLPAQALSVGGHDISLFFVPLVGVLLLGVIPLIWGYWLFNEKQKIFSWASSVFLGVASLVFFVREFSILWGLCGVVIIMSWLFYGVIYALTFKNRNKADYDSAPQDRMSKWLSNSVKYLTVLLIFFAIDSFGLYLYNKVSQLGMGGAGALASIMTVVGFSKKIISFSPTSKSGVIAKGLGTIFAGIMTFVLLGIILSIVAAFSYSILLEKNSVNSIDLTGTITHHANISYIGIVIAFSVSMVLSLLWGRIFSFINQSSFHAFFESRITRTYLGASNRNRKRITEVDKNDNIALEDYKPFENGGPLHLIATTVNETVDGRSQIHSLHNAGVPMAIGPAGVSVSGSHHALWHDGQLKPILKDKGYNVFDNEGDPIIPENLNLGQWVAISAAAASTGMGAKTSVLSSILFALLNIRLGYWWDSGMNRGRRRLFEIQKYFAKEALARFPGTSDRRWYITDGGHSENLAGYELFRRQLPVIVVCDNEQDKNFTFAGLGNMIRRIRNSFGAETHFLSSDELDQVLDPSVRSQFGSPDKFAVGSGSLKRIDLSLKDNDTNKKYKLTGEEDGFSECHAALARVTYPDGKVSWLIYIKPSFTGDETADLMQYKAHHPDFPHETTADQFFNPAQWESFRKMGEHLGEAIFADSNGDKAPIKWIINGKGPNGNN